MAYKTVNLAPDLWAIENDFVRCFLISGKNGSLLIDSCMSGGEDFRAAVLDITGGKTPEMTITHGDGDHIGGFIKDDTVSVHPAEYEHLGKHDFYLRPLWDGTVFSAGNRTLKAKLLPGHTPGATAFIDDENKMIFIGDSVSDSHIFMCGSGRNLYAYLCSLAYLHNNFAGYGFYACHGTAVLPASALEAQILCAGKVFAGTIDGETPPNGLPGKLYRSNGAGILY
ncbi:MAG: MBL fold metallo-hydrolase [Ruminococcus sp.]|jgi:glyoxylase-like metal-dependent hydrolase (beta-lactamase superfamily II)|nr:MBL fold metallo-hydrolase [Ruminococcus sp.]